MKIVSISPAKDVFSKQVTPGEVEELTFLNCVNIQEQ